jgi:cyclohexadieny/prephenate dehydrogenase
VAEPIFRRLALLGVGLIGSSVARIAKERGDLAAEVIVNARTRKTLDRVVELGFADRVEADPARAVEGADCVMLCAPVGAFAALAEAIGPALAPGAVLTDVGSTKQSVIRDVGPFVPAGVHFVPAHPLAGTEYSGPDAGFTTLFQGRWTLLTPPAGTDEAAIARVEEFWRRCGSMVERMEPGITTACWRSFRICRICWRSPFVAPPTIWPRRPAGKSPISLPRGFAISPASRPAIR